MWYVSMRCCCNSKKSTHAHSPFSMNRWHLFFVLFLIYVTLYIFEERCFFKNKYATNEAQVEANSLIAVLPTNNNKFENSQKIYAIKNFQLEYHRLNKSVKNGDFNNSSSHELSNSTPENKIICPNGTALFVAEGGNTGNNIWEFMSLYAVTKMFPNKNFIPYITPGLKKKVEDIFQPLDVPLASSYAKCYKSYKKIYILKNKPPQYIKNLIIKPKTTVGLEMFSARYKEIIQYGIENIKKVLRFRPKDVESAMKTLRRIKSRFKLSTTIEPVYIGVHYRGTDYLDYLQSNRHFNESNGISTYKYYTKAMDYFKKRHKHVIFIIISIDYVWLNKNVMRLSGNIAVNPNLHTMRKVDDFVLLSHCNHSIINYGSFSASTALFSGGTTVVYDLNMPLDGKGGTLALGIESVLDNWFLLN